MIEKVAHIKNPLTVIAMFAGIAEVSGTVVLPFLDDSTQGTYVWFLMVFPCLLVTAFFGTLLFKHHVLYAPSDFKDEKIFANMFKPGSLALRAEKLEEETSADAEPQVTSVNASASTPENVEVEKLGMTPSSHAQIAANASLAEDLVITRLASERQTRFVRNVSPSSMPNVMFDAVAKDGNNQLIVEVKYSRSGMFSRPIMERMKHRFEEYFHSLPQEIRRGTSLIFAVVLDGDAEARANSLKSRYKNMMDGWDIPVHVRVYCMSELQKGFREAA